MKCLTVSRYDTVYDWLEKHLEVNKSGFFRRLLNLWWIMEEQA